VLGSAIFQHLLVLNPQSLLARSRLARALGLLALLMGACSLPARAAPPEGEPVRADLIAEPAAIVPGQPFWVGVRLRMRQGWHVYWRNPGDSGEAPTITWQLPPSLAAGPIAWPTPSRIGLAHLVNFGYQGETLLLTRIEPAPALADSAMIGAHVTWLVCEKECIPGEASLSIDLPVAHGQPSAANAATAAAFDAARKDLPQPSPWRARMELGPERLTLALDGAPQASSLAASLLPASVRSAYFFPNAETLVRHAAPQQLRLVGDGLRLQLERSALSISAPSDGGGVLLLEEGDGRVRHSFELANVSIDQAPTPAPVATLMAVLNAAALALLGGVILNLMPCVFPVLSIKVLGLIEQAGASPRQLRRHGLAYTAGVLIAFAALGMGLLGVRAAGAEVGWGFQLQSRLAVLGLAYLLFAVGLNLSGAFQLGSSLQGLGHGLARRHGLTGSLFSGALAAVVATPCTAPFMATALGFAFTQPSAIALSVMLALGLGLALPYLALTHAPRLIPRLPRPGAWMETLRQVLAFPIYATVAWLIWVLAQQVDAADLFAALAGLVLVGLAAWSFNAAQRAGRWGRRASRAALLAALLGVVVALAAVGRDRAVPAPLDLAAAAPEPFTQARLEALIAARHCVFVNLTAAWCITCLVNEQAALASERVRAAFAAKGITYLKGDWTRRNPEITRLLAKHGRSGVPLYLVFAGEADPVVLPQILTPATILAAIARIPDRGPQRASLPTPTKE
jgi:thiol:disulfide interchange protein DsbD